MTLAPWLRIPGSALSFFSLLTTAVLSTPTKVSAQQPLFPVTNFYSPASPISAFATGDFNGDGQPDIAFTSPGTPTSVNLIILLNNGSGLPPTSSTIPLNCTSVSQILSTDLNKDKKSDLLLACADGNVITLLGNGDGTFQKSAVYSTSAAPTLAQPVDLNGDGYLDIAVSTPTAILVMLNQGTTAAGTFLPAKTYPVPTGLSISLAGVQGGDFNGDGKQDLIAVNTNGSQSIPFVILYGNGDGTFQIPQTPNQVSASGPFVVADFNHDGMTDVAYLEPGSATGAPQAVQILLGNSNGTFTGGPGSNLSLNGFTKYTSLVYAGSTNSDKNINLAIVGSNTTIIRGDGSGGFSFGPSYAISGTPLPETESDGTTNILFLTPNGFSILSSNGDGTFQGLPNLQSGANGFVAADFNGDGLTDLITLNALFTINLNTNLVTSLGRGNGTFLVTNQTSTSGNTTLLVAGDFNGDGKIDVAGVQPGTSNFAASIAIYLGNGDGSFKPALTATNLPAINPTHAIAGDFNGDGKLDVVFSYPQQLAFLPGNGDGTFGTPVTFGTSASSPSGPLLSADLNNDKHPDLIWNGFVFLNNGDGTFNQIAVGIAGSVLAVGDLDGDSIPDIVIQPPPVAGIAPSAVIYSGIGDGTFHSAALYTTPSLPASTTVTSAVIGNVNADGHPDLVLQNDTPNTTSAINVYLGDGKGNFTPDSNTYFSGNSVTAAEGSAAATEPMLLLARLNNQAPALSNDNALDLITFTSGGATSLLNQSNPTPTAPSPLPSTVTLGIGNTISVAPTQTFMLTAIVSGAAPTGTVSFTSGGTILGTASVLLNGHANVTLSFPAEGSYSVVANYSGDTNNLPSSSAPIPATVARIASTTILGIDTTPGANQVFHLQVSFSGYSPTGTVTFLLANGTVIGTAQVVQGQANFAYFFPVAGTYSVQATYAGDVANLPSVSGLLTITVMVPDFLFSAPGDHATITAGQAATTTFTMIPTYGYSGTVQLTCGQLLTGETCTFTPPTLRSLNGLSVSSVFVISTTASSTARLRGFSPPFNGITWATLFGLIFFRKRIRHTARNLIALLMFSAVLLQLMACSSSSPSSNTPPPNQTPGTPKGTQTITVTAADNAGGSAHTFNVQLTIQ
jgi:hypothetical protein